MTLIRKGIEQLRREGLANAQSKLEQRSTYQAKVDTLSKHNVGGYYDIRAIVKSQQFKEQKNFYDIDQVTDEFTEMLTQSRLVKHKSKYLDYLSTTGRNGDSFQIRSLGKFISELINDISDTYFNSVRFNCC